MANTIWPGVNINTGNTELAKYNVAGDFAEVYTAAVTTALVNTDTILGPVVQAGLFIVDVIAAPGDLDSAASPLIAFSVGYINNGTITPAAFIATPNAAARTGAVARMDVASGYGTTFSNAITLCASITAGAGTAVAGAFRLGVVATATP